MYKDTVTLFNRSNDGRWFPTVLKNVNLNMDKAAVVARYGENSSDSAILNIRYIGEKVIAGKYWRPPTEWTGESEITFRTGNNFDFFWLGEWTYGTVTDSEYKGGFYQWMNQNYDYVYAITSVTWFTAIKHFEVTGK